MVRATISIDMNERVVPSFPPVDLGQLVITD
jgi:hypothetical protein